MGRKLDPPPTNGARPRTLRELAVVLNIPYLRACRLRKDGLQARPDGTFDLQDAQAFLQARAARGQDISHASPVAFAFKERLIKAKALTAERELHVAMGNLVEKQMVVQQWRERVVQLKNRLIPIGRELAPRLVGKGPQEIAAIIEETILDRLRVLAHETYHPMNGNGQRGHGE